MLCNHRSFRDCTNILCCFVMLLAHKTDRATYSCPSWLCCNFCPVFAILGMVCGCDTLARHVCLARRAATMYARAYVLLSYDMVKSFILRLLQQGSL